MPWLPLRTFGVIMCVCSGCNSKHVWHLYTSPRCPSTHLSMKHTDILGGALQAWLFPVLREIKELFWICFHASFNSVLYICSWMIPLSVTVKLLHQALTEKLILPCHLDCRSMSWNFYSTSLSLLSWMPKTNDVLLNCLKSVRLFWKAANEKS